MTHTTSFATKLGTLGTLRERLCVGIDPHHSTLEQWGLPDSASGASRLASVIVDQVVDAGLSIVKPQVALFERHGLAGLSALSHTIADARARGLTVIADAKRGDVGSSVEGYGDAWLGPGGDFESDAMTAVAYQGVGSVEPLMRRALAHKKGLFVLVNTSNPEGWAIQQATTATGSSVAQAIFDELYERRNASGEDDWLGAVIGATLGPRTRAVDPGDGGGLWILAPGFGHQGASLSQARHIYGASLPRVIPTVSRSVTAEGPDRVAAAIAAHLGEIGSS